MTVLKCVLMIYEVLVIQCNEQMCVYVVFLSAGEACPDITLENRGRLRAWRMFITWKI